MWGGETPHIGHKKALENNKRAKHTINASGASLNNFHTMERSDPFNNLKTNKMNKFRKNFEPTDNKNIGEINNQESLTIQGDTVPLREMLRRYQLGQPLTGKRAEYWNEEDFDEGSLLDSPGTDLVDVHTEATEVKRRFADAKSKHEEQKRLDKLKAEQLKKDAQEKTKNEPKGE